MADKVKYEQVREMMSAGVHVVAVLPSWDHMETHIPGATCIPLKQLDAESVEELDRATPVIVYGEDNQSDLSPRAAKRLESLGFTEVYEYTGGKADWLANGQEVEGEKAGAPTAGGLARTDVLVCDLRDRAEEVAARMRQANVEEAVVVRGGNVVMGRVRLSQLRHNDEGPLETVMEPGPTTFRPDTPLADMLKRMGPRWYALCGDHNRGRGAGGGAVPPRRGFTPEPRR